MIYCADTWFVLALFSGDDKAVKLVEEADSGKTTILIPIIVYAESIRKLLSRGESMKKIEYFYEGIKECVRIKIVALELDIAEEAAKISYSNSLSLVDSIIAATTKLLWCNILLSQDTDYNVLVKKKYLKVSGW